MQVMFDATMLLAQEYRSMIARAKLRSGQALTAQLQKVWSCIWLTHPLLIAAFPSMQHAQRSAAVVLLHVAVTQYSVAKNLSGKGPPRCSWSLSTDTPKCNALSISEGARPAEQISGGVQETNHARRAALQVRLKRLKFAERQAQLQLLVEREQGELMQMNDRAYRSVARQCVRQRLEKMRAVRDFLERIPMQLPSGPSCLFLHPVLL